MECLRPLLLRWLLVGCVTLHALRTPVSTAIALMCGTIMFHLFKSPD